MIRIRIIIIMIMTSNLLLGQTIHTTLITNIVEFSSLPGGEQPIRIIHDGSKFYYNNRVGTIYEVDNSGNQQVKFDSGDHLLDEIYGLDYADNKIYVGGVKNLVGDSTWTGHILSVDLSTNVWSTLVNTDTLYKGRSFHDHRLNFVKVSGQNIYAHIASRTNSGELQEVAGVFGTNNLREHSSTGKIYKFPLSPSSPIGLEDNDAWLQNSDYVYACGVRNAFAVDIDDLGDMYVVVNSDRRDVPEPIYKIANGGNAGFPFVIAGVNNPFDNDGYSSMDDTLLLDPPANNQGFYNNDPDFPIDPQMTDLFPMQNIGPDADKFRNANTGMIYDASDLGISMNGISGHKSPTSLFFDSQNVLPEELAGTGLLTNWTRTNSTYMYDVGADLLSLKILPNNQVMVNRLVSGFQNPMDVVIVNNDAYLLDKNKIWKIEFQNSPLPVVLKSFSASVENCEIVLSWQSESEHFFRNYILERSYDGVNFSSIHSVEGLARFGGSYSFTDDLENYGKRAVFYRLKMVDNDGTFSYSAVIVESPNCESLNFYPNPVKNDIYIEDLEVWEYLQIFDMDGKIVLEKNMSNLTVDVSFLPRGNYTLRLINKESGKNVRWRFVKL